MDGVNTALILKPIESNILASLFQQSFSLKMGTEILEPKFQILYVLKSK